MLPLLAACAPAPSTPAEEPPDEVTGPSTDPADWPVTVGGDRPAALVTPSAEAYDGGALPLVVLLHGYGANATLQDLYFGLSDRVDDLGFALLLPEGTVDALGLQFWNATPACCDFYGSDPDDVGYLLGLLDEVAAAVPIDPDRIGFVGHSNGGFMSYTMACAAADRIAGVAVLAGSTFADPADCAAAGPVSVLHVHGDADPDVRYEGTPVYPGAEEIVARWAALAACAEGPVATDTLDYDAFVAGAETEVRAYRDCARDVRLWAMAGSGHIPAITEAFQADLADWLLAQRRAR